MDLYIVDWFLFFDLFEFWWVVFDEGSDVFVWVWLVEIVSYIFVGVLGGWVIGLGLVVVGLFFYGMEGFWCYVGGEFMYIVLGYFVSVVCGC